MVLPALALDDDEFEGYAADTLTVKVGYFGGPYYVKRVFTLDELWSMDLVYADYTFIDNMPSVVIDHVVGVRLADVMDAAGIDLNSIQYFYFYTKDKTDSYYSHAYTKSGLIDTPRYCFYSLPDNFDEETGLGNEYAASYAEPVETVLALADDWTRTLAGATFGSDYLNLNTNTRFRLVFGQTDTESRTATESAKWIHEIVVELGGAPTLTLDASALEGEVGSVLRTEPRIEGDPTVIENTPILWRSSDETVATVDASGNITMRGEGNATITAEFAGVVASVEVRGVAGEVPEPAVSPMPGELSPSPGPTGQPQPTAQPEPPKEGDEPEPASSLTLMKPVTLAQNEWGGVQNWRDTEMSETARELPNIQEQEPLLPWMGLAAALLLLMSGGVYTALFYASVRRKNR